MKLRVFALLLITALLLNGCAAAAARLDTAEDSVEKLVDSAEDAVESAIMDTKVPAPTTAAAQPPTVEKPTEPVPAKSAPTESRSALLTKEEAEAIALEHAGLTADQVTYLRTEYEIDDGIPQYEVEFHQDRWEYDYEINAETGQILSFDRDD